MPKLTQNHYGKARVRLMKVDRATTPHRLHEWTVKILLEGNFDSAFTAADNTRILPTDTMKNTVYWLARKSSSTTPEAFAAELVQHFLSTNPHASTATVEIDQKACQPAVVDGQPHPTTYRHTAPETRTATVTKSGNQPPIITSGVDGLTLLKTTQSAFTNFLRDPLTTLPESTDRIFATRATITFTYASPPSDFDAAYHRTIDTLIRTFANHHSLSVQHTLYDMGAAALAALPEIASITLTMPNLHCNLANLTPLGQDNPQMIYIPTDEPHGHIQATIER